MTLIAALSVMLVCAYVLGRLAERLHQPALLGQIVAGILVGPSLLDWVHSTPALAAVSDLSILFVVVTAGLEMRFQHVLDSLRGRGVFALLLGFAIPAGTATVFALALDMKVIPSIVIVLCVSVTALPVALRILHEFKLLDTRVARIAISGALLSDVIVLLVLGIAMTMSQRGAQTTMGGTVGVALLKLVVLFAVVGACHYACQRLTEYRVARNVEPIQPTVDTVLILTMVFMLCLGAVAEALGFHFVIGVFLAALMVTRDLISDARFQSLERTCELVTVSLFGPLFLAFQGIQFELASLGNVSMVLGLIVIATLSKLAGGYAAARMAHLPNHESRGVAIIMNARGVMEMVVASIAYRAGLVDQELYSALLFMGIVTTVITPMMLKRWILSPEFATIVRE